MKQPAVYLLASKKHGTLYIGVTSNLVARTWQHRQHVVDGFTKRYNVDKLVWYELPSRVHGSGDSSREAAEEVEPGVEVAVGGRGESRVAGFVG